MKKFREFYEETNLRLKDVVLKGYITFPGIYYGEDEGMFLYAAYDYEGMGKTGYAF